MIANLTPDLEALIPEKRAAEFLGLSIKTLQKRRVTGNGPKYVRISSRCVRYRRADLIAWAIRWCVPVPATPAASRETIQLRVRDDDHASGLCFAERPAGLD